MDFYDLRMTVLSHKKQNKKPPIKNHVFFLFGSFLFDILPRLLCGHVYLSFTRRMTSFYLPYAVELFIVRNTNFLWLAFAFNVRFSMHAHAGAFQSK